MRRIERRIALLEEAAAPPPGEEAKTRILAVLKSDRDLAERFLPVLEEVLEATGTGKDLKAVLKSDRELAERFLPVFAELLRRTEEAR